VETPSDRFWELIDLARARTTPDGASADPAALQAVLDPLSTPDVMTFAQEFYRALVRLNRWSIWGAGYVMSDGMGDDSFHYFRSWIIGKGRQAFETALTSADDLGQFVTGDEEEGFDNELLEYVPLTVLEERGIEEDPRDDIEEDADDEPEGEAWDEDSVGDLYPKLSAQFG
jgi:hypothetical protein